VETIQWPALPAPSATTLMAMQFQLEQSQWWSHEAIIANQFRQLEPLLLHAYQTTPYYKTVLDTAGVQLQKIPLQKQWGRIPILTRKKVQSAGDQLISNQVPPDHGKIGETWTSGSTGRPICVKSTNVTGLFWHAGTLREHLWHQRDFTKKLAVIRHTAVERGFPPNGETYPNWGPSTHLIYPTGPSVFLNITSTLEEQAAWLMAQDPTYLLSYPSNLHALALHFLKTGRKLPKLSQVRTLGEALGPGLRDAVKQAWGVKVVDMYSSQEAGYLGLQCPHHDHYHVQSENVLLEVLDEKNRHCGPGEVGRVIVTTLHNFATPLIRYEIGDFAEMGERCNCGRGLPVLKRILGRVRNMITLPTGEQRWPILGYKQFEAVIPVKQIQTIQDAPDHLEMRLVVEGSITQDQEQQVTAIVRKSLGYPFTIKFTYMDEIPRAKSGKYEEFVSLTPD